MIRLGRDPSGLIWLERVLFSVVGQLDWAEIKFNLVVTGFVCRGDDSEERERKRKEKEKEREKRREKDRQRKADEAAEDEAQEEQDGWTKVKGGLPGQTQVCTESH